MKKKIILHTFLFTCILLSLKAEEKSGSQPLMVPLKGKILKFSDPCGPFSYSTEVLKYKSIDGAKIEATLLVPNTQNIKPGIVFVHMWSRDRHTYWGLPEFFATYGYASIYMDMRGHGNSNFPDTDKKITIEDKTRKYINLYNDIIPAIDIINNQNIVKKDNIILIGASLGCPLGAIAAEKKRNKIIGMIYMAPAIDYFDANCSKAIKNMKDIPTYVILEKTDRSFKSGQIFFNNFNLYKTLLTINKIGHGTDVLYYDIGFPSILLSWVQQIEKLSPIVKELPSKNFKTE